MELPQVVKTDTGLTRYSVKCRLCKDSWIESADNPKALGYAHTCTGMLEWVAVCKVKGSGYPVWRLDYKPLTWRHRADAHKTCDNRCMGAAGHKCDCPCLGLNHGVNRGVANPLKPKPKKENAA